jgi:hypothetical protein
MTDIPLDCVRHIVEQWWVESQKVEVGSLVFANISQYEEIPLTLNPIGRTEATRHDSAEFEIAPLRANQKVAKSKLPVAALSLKPEEYWRAYRSKMRPCLIIAEPGHIVDSNLTKGSPKRNYHPFYLAAPYYGVKSGKRAGYPTAFIERVRHCEYPQFMWDNLPHKTGEESLLRLDQIQPIGANFQAYRDSGFKLSDEALEVFITHLNWRISGICEDNTLLAEFKKEIDLTFDS